MPRIPASIPNLGCVPATGFSPSGSGLDYTNWAMATPISDTQIQPRSPRGEFANQPFIDFKTPDNARAMQAALEAVASQLGREYDLLIGGRRLKTEGKIRSLNPARPAQIVGVHQKAGAEHAELAMSAALQAFETWSRTPVETRASLLLDAAEIIRKRAFEFCAWLTFEVGKNWAEADADVGETIDFLEFYAREALRLAAAIPPIQYPGERNELHYIPLGRGRGDSSLELPFRHHGGHDRGLHRHRQHGDSEAFQRRPHHRRQVH